MLNRGTVDQRLAWIFALYDNKHRGYIVEDDFEKIIRAVYELMGLQLNDARNVTDLRNHTRDLLRASTFHFLEARIFRNL